jgi:SAM-dependent methyltransferase
MTTQTALEYWKRQKIYPFPFTKRRRIHELNYLLPRLEKVQGKRLLDLGCGDGSLLECLLRLTDFEEFHGYDVAKDLLAQIDPRVTTRVYDLSNPGPLPDVDATIIAGVIQYLFDDEIVAKVLSLVTSPIVWIRSTCTLNDTDEPINRDGYVCVYRTLPNTYALITRYFQITAVDRVYPDEIESRFGTKQVYFEGRLRSRMEQ